MSTHQTAFSFRPSRFRRSALLVLLVASVALPRCVANGAEPANPILAQLTEEGVPMPSGRKVTLTQPVMDDGLAGADQDALIKELGGRNSFDRMVRDSIVAPLSLEIENVAEDSEDARIRTIDLAFVAYGTLDVIYSEEFLESLANIANSNERDEFPTEARMLESADLSKRNLAGGEPGSNDHWFHGTFAMFDRVYMSATRHATSSRTNDSVILASILAPEFIKDDELPNQWQPIVRNDAGVPSLGAAVPYASAGFFVKVTELKNHDGALFIEYHHVFAEPTGWFDGRALLRSKLPLIMQNRVRSFRRQLKVASE